MLGIFRKSACDSAAKYAEKHVTIQNLATLPDKAYNELYYAKEMIGNYAKHKKVDVDFYDAMREADDFISAHTENLLSNTVGMRVTKPNNKTEKALIKYSEKSDKPFLRQVYENLVRMTSENAKK